MLLLSYTFQLISVEDTNSYVLGEKIKWKCGFSTNIYTSVLYPIFIK